MVLALTFIPNLLVYPLVYLMTAGFACEVLREHGIIADENAEQTEDGAELYGIWTSRETEKEMES